MTLRTAALCAGYGGLEMGLDLAGIDHKLTWYSEIDASASKVMAHHNPDAPNLGDLTQITDPPKVDIVTAGFPCQPVSGAGKRQGINDERWLIDDVVSVWERSGARWLVLENVSGLLSANNGEAFGRVIDALAEVGASAEWTHLRASDVGVCHRRERWFCVAYTNYTRDEGIGRAEPGRRSIARPVAGKLVAHLPTPTASNPNEGEDPDLFDARQVARIEAGSRPSPQPLGMVVGQLPTPTASDGDGGRRATKPTPTAGDSKSSGSYGYSKTETHTPGLALTDATARGLVDWKQYGPAIEHHERVLGRPAPEPTADGKLSPKFVEWMMMLPEGHVTDVIDRRSSALKILGNGVVPLQAAAAIGELIAQTNESTQTEHNPQRKP